MRRRGSSGRFSRAVAASAGLHALALAALWLSVSGAEPPPRAQVFRVDIVSPPPSVAGEPAPAPPAPETAAPEPEPEAAAPPPVPAPEPEVREPAPTPEPAPQPSPPKRSEPKQPARESRPTPAPKRAERPRETAKKEAPKKTEAPSARTPVAPAGRDPDPTSPGGEGLAVRTEGAEFVDPAYLANIIRQLKRYFRPPPGSRTDMAEVRFWINRDGTVSDIAVGRNRGSFQFRAAAMEAVEQAGLNRAFGPLPQAYRGNRLPVSFTFEPES
ncbi:MAG TPA: TonB C-terminal domain-containing protein [Longimicrobiaceae bacterium]|nr:TonB C-terminal domain-containing protein [Longimicrobiaceae bacterium]